jgi:hypothetical protein
VSPSALLKADREMPAGALGIIVGAGMLIEGGDPVRLSPIRTTNAGQGFRASGGRRGECYGLASAHWMCPSKPGDVAIAR